MENTFVDGLKAGKTKAFDFQRYDAWSEILFDAVLMRKAELTKI